MPLLTFSSVNPALLSHVAGVLLTGLVKLFTDGDPGLKGQVYAVIGQLSLRFPSLVNQDLHLLTTFLTALGQVKYSTLFA